MLAQMTGDIQKHLLITPFEPFSVRTADGCEYPAPTVDHIYITPGPSSRVVISDNDGIPVVLPGLLISSIVHARSPSQTT